MATKSFQFTASSDAMTVVVVPLPGVTAMMVNSLMFAVRDHGTKLSPVEFGTFRPWGDGVHVAISIPAYIADRIVKGDIVLLVVDYLDEEERGNQLPPPKLTRIEQKLAAIADEWSSEVATRSGATQPNQKAVLVKSALSGGSDVALAEARRLAAEEALRRRRLEYELHRMREKYEGWRNNKKGGCAFERTVEDDDDE